MASKLSRFLLLEKRRPASLEPSAPQELPRFQPPEEAGLELEVRSPEEMPFCRCQHCQADNTLGAQTCRICNADLCVPSQRAYNEALWQKMRHGALEEQSTSEKHASEASRALAEQLGRKLEQELTDEDPDVASGGSRGWWLAAAASLALYWLRPGLGVFVGLGFAMLWGYRNLRR